jgi:tRNA threonylcarbamoyladenosine modification (KEOPS) complex  Pcc1 subunit
MSSDGHNRLFLEIEDEVARAAVAPEVGGVEGEDGELTEEGVLIRAEDPRTLRAAVNGWTRLVSVASDDRLQP